MARYANSFYTAGLIIPEWRADEPAHGRMLIQNIHIEIERERIELVPGVHIPGIQYWGGWFEALNWIPQDQRTKWLAFGPRDLTIAFDHLRQENRWWGQVQIDGLVETNAWADGGSYLNRWSFTGVGPLT